MSSSQSRQSEQAKLREALERYRTPAKFHMLSDESCGVLWEPVDRAFQTSQIARDVAAYFRSRRGCRK